LKGAQFATQIVKKTALQMGFSFCGISKAEFLKSEAPKLESWLEKDLHGSMQYMENHFEKRLDPTLLVPGAKSVISLMYNYFPSDEKISTQSPKIARYAYGEDYHVVIKDKLFEMVSLLKHEIGEIEGRVFVDSAPVLERAWAAKSGLGWIGKNAMLINKQQGSFFFLAQIISDLELDADGPIKDFCGTCTACIDACPTEAIVDNRVIDSNKCISYLTIELKESIPSSFKNKMEDWVFGCDICQEVCPWNRFSKPHSENRFAPLDAFENLKLEDLLEITDDVFNLHFKKSALSRTKKAGLLRNATFLKIGE
jgi:epoxyqueuosine reductase